MYVEFVLLTPETCAQIQFTHAVKASRVRSFYTQRTHISHIFNRLYDRGVPAIIITTYENENGYLRFVMQDVLDHLY